MEKTKRKYHLLDAIRGLAILNMICFHFLYDVMIVFGKNTGWYRLPSVSLWQQLICFTFIIIAGVSFHFSRSPLKRGLIINGCGLLITAVTVIFMPTEAVWFGILSFIGCAILLLALTRRIMERIPALPGLLLCVLLFLVFRPLPQGFLNLGFTSLTVPSFLYESKLLTIFGLPYSGFYSSDYFPIFPWYFLFMAGYFFWKIALSYEWDRFFLSRIPFLSAIGTKSLGIYLIHQPAAMLLCYVLSFLGIL